MRKQLAVAALCFCLWTWPIQHAPAQNVELSSRDIIRALQSPLDMKLFQNPMTLKEALGLMYEHVHHAGILGRDVGLPVFIDQQAFTAIDPNVADILETPVKFPPYPKQMTVNAAIHLALSNVQTGDATYVIRRGAVVITTGKQNRLENTLKQKVLADYVRKPLDEAIHDLAEQTGVSIQLDSRAIKDKQNLQVTALFRNDTSLRDALIMLADMAGLQIVELDSSVYITSPANAEAVKKTALKK